MRRLRGGELMALRLLLRARERVGGAGGALLAEDEPQLLGRAQAVRGVRSEGRARLRQAQGAEQIAMKEARLARHLAALRHVLHRPPSALRMGMESPPRRQVIPRFRKWRGFRDQPVNSLQIRSFFAGAPASARILRRFWP